MLDTQPNTAVYHGWRITLTQEDTGVYFECLPPSGCGGCDDGFCYPTPAVALTAACEFIDREIAVLALINLADEWFSAGLIDPEEYWSLTDFA